MKNKDMFLFITEDKVRINNNIINDNDKNENL